MTDERDIEKKLRAAAAQRRRVAGGPFAMHPVTRRMLHAEIRREHTTKSHAEGGRNPIFAALWLRIASAAGTMMILVVASWFMFFRQLPPRSEPKAAHTQVTALNPASVRAEADAALAPLAKNKIELADRTPVPDAAPLSGFTDGMKLGEAETAQDLHFLNHATIATDSARRTDVADSLLAAKSVENTAARKSEPPAPVLISFRLEQNGDTLRLIDTDGSVYSGQSTGTNGAFRATGTNLTLGQNIVITAQLTNGCVVGRATLADGRQVPLDASPAKP